MSFDVIISYTLVILIFLLMLYYMIDDIKKSKEVNKAIDEYAEELKQKGELAEQLIVELSGLVKLENVKVSEEYATELEAKIEICKSLGVTKMDVPNDTLKVVRCELIRRKNGF